MKGPTPIAYPGSITRGRRMKKRDWSATRRHRRRYPRRVKARPRRFTRTRGRPTPKRRPARALPGWRRTTIPSSACDGAIARVCGGRKRSPNGETNSSVAIWETSTHNALSDVGSNNASWRAPSVASGCWRRLFGPARRSIVGVSSNLRCDSTPTTSNWAPTRSKNKVINAVTTSDSKPWGGAWRALKKRSALSIRV